MGIYLENTFPEIFKTIYPLGIVTTNVKDVWKWIVGQRIGTALSKSFDINSDFTIILSFHYKDDDSEARVLSVLYYNFL